MSARVRRHVARRGVGVRMARGIARLDAGDRALLAAIAGAPRTACTRRAWRTLTHLGGARATTLACLVPLLAGGPWRAVGVRTTALVLLSHLLVQLVKRSVGRPRPRMGTAPAAIAAPDRFSFPSGHAAAALAVALGLGGALPALLPLLVTIAVAVGVSRAVLGVHYLGDVLAGLALTAASALLLAHAGG